MAMQTPDMIETDFVVMKEDYSRYLVHDGTILKVKIVVRKILRSSDFTPQGYPSTINVDSMNAVVAIVPLSLKREASKEEFEPNIDVGEEVGFDPQEEKWQEYMTNEGLKILVKPVVTKVIRYKKYNNFGEPIYAATVQAITNISKLGST